MLWRLRSFPDFVEPCLPSPVERPPTGPHWIHEIKHDGFRLLARGRAKHARISLNSRPRSRVWGHPSVPCSQVTSC